MNNKTEQFITYIASKHISPSLTSLMKLSYLVDLVSFKSMGKQISDFEYVRYHYGPYDSKINTCVDSLLKEGILQVREVFTQTAEGYSVYSVNPNAENTFDALSESEMQTIDSVLEGVKGYGAKTLTEMAYKTNPMKKLGATLGGNESLGMKLDLSL